MVKLWQSIFEHQIKSDGPAKPFDQSQIHYLLGGHEAYPSHSYSQFYFYDDRFDSQPYKLRIYYHSIKNRENTGKRKVQLINSGSCIKDKKENLVL